MTEERQVVINVCYGGFSLSPKGEAAYLLRKGKEAFFYVHERTAEGRPDFDRYKRVTAEEAAQAFMFTTTTRNYGPEASKEQVYSDLYYFSQRDTERDDPDLVAVVEELGKSANGSHAKLQVVEIPADVEWRIEEYDGLEWVAEAHRTWS